VDATKPTSEPAARPSPPPPLEADDKLVIRVLTAGWVVALAVLLIVRDSLPPGQRWWIWTCACGVAFAVNMGRTYALAEIRFVHGQAAFDRAHDTLGLLAFVISGLVFYFLSGRLAAPARRAVVRTVQRR